MPVNSPSFSRTGQAAAWGFLALFSMFLGMAGCSKDGYQDVLRSLREKEKLVDAVRLNLLLAVEAEKNAMLSSVDTEAISFVNQARQAMGTARNDLTQLTALVEQGRDSKEVQALSTVTADFGELAGVDAELLRMVGRNTNLRASMLSRTDAAVAASRFQEALAPIVDGPSCQAAREGLRAINASLNILSLHARHIEESTEAIMDTLEVAMHKQNALADTALTNLSDLLPPDAAEQLVAAKTAYAGFWRVTQEILGLSRENSNINALALVMGRKRMLIAKSLDDLAALYAVVASKEFKATR
ncbi:MAG: hypothetical protein AB9872_01115 [Solidesulfovibrio sp.]